MRRWLLSVYPNPIPGFVLAFFEFSIHTNLFRVQDGDEEKINHRIPHRFEPFTNMGASWCCHCGYMLPLGRKSARRCSDSACGITCHDHCTHLVPDFCGMSMENANRLLTDWRNINKIRQTAPKPPAKTPMLPPSSPEMITGAMGGMKLSETPMDGPPPRQQSPSQDRYNQRPPPQQQPLPGPYPGPGSPAPRPPGARIPVPPAYHEPATGRPASGYEEVIEVGIFGPRLKSH